MIYRDEDRLDDLLLTIKKDSSNFIGFPGATDFDYSDLYPFFGYLLNNAGDPYVTPLNANHTKQFEQEVVDFFANHFRAPTDDRWGYVTTGGTEGNLFALYIARSLYPTAHVYYSQAAHYSVPKNIDLLAMQGEQVSTNSRGEMDYRDLAKRLRKHNVQPALVVASIGTTMHEARDDVAKIRRVLHDCGVEKMFIHSDAALAGAYAPFIMPRPAFDFADGADSISVSGHKFIGSPIPCGAVVVRKSLRDQVSRDIEYIGAPDTTIGGSRSGHAPLLLWYALQKMGREGLKSRYENGLQLAKYLQDQLNAIGWSSWHYPGAITILIKSPSDKIVQKWQLATENGKSHVICMPGVTKEKVDRFIADLAASAR